MTDEVPLAAARRSRNSSSVPWRRRGKQSSQHEGVKVVGLLDWKGFLAKRSHEVMPGSTCSWSTNYMTQESLLWGLGPARG